MLITYPQNGQMRAPVFVTHNGQEHVLTPGQSLELAVRRGDAVTFRVGRFTKTHQIAFQSPQAEFAVVPNKQLQIIFVAAMMILAGGLYLLKQVDNTWLSVIVVVALIGYEVLNYFTGYAAVPWHDGRKR
ncbi:hypothetical protein [Lacticaseibacillus kribbianus]|uniref:hypothetical protein n=1 Tax=Lacticaseibacillus kribbianus TaxID=2926292 RepID=UPI001CD5FCAA|nr:hypothetical protein [Lacticaseibacillus kribbianus]